MHCGLVELEGMSVLEAMAAAKTLLIAAGTDSACPELLPDPEQQFLAGDVSQLTARIDAWLAEPEARAQQGAQNRSAARAFGHEHSVAALLEHYRSVLRPAVD